MGMLAYFVNGYVNANQLTPNYILILFIVSVLALAWAIFTLFSYHRSSSNALFVAIIDLGTKPVPLHLHEAQSLVSPDTYLCAAQLTRISPRNRIRRRLHRSGLLPPLHRQRELHQHQGHELRRQLRHIRELQRQRRRRRHRQDVRHAQGLLRLRHHELHLLLLHRRARLVPRRPRRQRHQVLPRDALQAQQRPQAQHGQQAQQARQPEAQLPLAPPRLRLGGARARRSRGDEGCGSLTGLNRPTLDVSGGNETDR